MAIAPDQYEELDAKEVGWKVTENVLIGIYFIFFVSMMITGGVLFDTCSPPPLLPIYTIAEGAAGLVLVLFHAVQFKHRTLPLGRVTSLSIAIFWVMVMIAGLVAGTHFTRTSDCPTPPRLYTANIFFTVILWLSALSAGVAAMCKIWHTCFKQEDIQL